jgi:c-di-GMP-related signal transduction protein
VAEKVETWEEFQAGLAQGYELFQGYFFRKPALAAARDIPALKLNLIRLIEAANRPDVDFDRPETQIRREPALAVKLLRYHHSAGFGWRHDVGSISQAIRILGERATRKWVSLVALTLIAEDKPREPAGDVADPGPDDGGDRAGRWARGQMSVPGEIREALLREGSPAGDMLALAVTYDRADWGRVAHLAERTGVPEVSLPEAYRRAVSWVDQVLGDVS